MAPIRPEDHAFVFQAAVLPELRGKLGLSQAQLAEFLDVPVNTLSRWERGSNVPDANALAALFSIAKERGVTPEFFKKRRIVISKRRNWKNRIVDWDFQNLGVDAEGIDEVWDELRQYIDLLCGSQANTVLYAYVPHGIGGMWGVEHSPQGKALQSTGFTMVSCHSDADRHIMDDGRAAFQDSFRPRESVYVLISDDGDYADYLKELRSAGVETFVHGTNECAKRLRAVVGGDHFIPWQRPYMVAKCYEVARKLVGKTITKGAFGNRCRVALEEDGLEGDEYEELLEDTGFSLNRPFASVLQHMNTMGILQVKPIENDPNRVTLTVPGM